MTFKEYFTRELPFKCGYDDQMVEAIGDLITLGLAEESRNPDFMSADKLTSKERASFLLPYPPADGFEYEYSRGLKVAEACILNHRKTHHDYSFTAEDEILFANLSEEEMQIAEAPAWDH